MTVQRIAEQVGELCEPILDTQTISAWDGKTKRTKRRVTAHPSLLDQLRAQADPASGAQDGGGGSKPGSRPAADLDAIEAIARIQAGTYEWMHRARLTVRPHLEGNLYALRGYSLAANDDTLAELAAAVHSWWRMARIGAGWEDQPYKPPLRCPECDTYTSNGGGLRVYYNQTARCLSCNEVWADEFFPPFVEWVKTETARKGKQ